MKERQLKSRNVYSHLPTRSTKIIRGTHYCHLLSDWKDISSSPRLSQELISISSESSRDIKELPLMYVFKTIILVCKKLSNSSKNKRLQDNLEIFFILLLILTKRKWKIRRFKMISAMIIFCAAYLDTGVESVGSLRCCRWAVPIECMSDCLEHSPSSRWGSEVKNMFHVGI